MHLVHADSGFTDWQQRDRYKVSRSWRADYCDSLEELTLTLRFVALIMRRSLARTRDKSHPRVSK